MSKNEIEKRKIKVVRNGRANLQFILWDALKSPWGRFELDVNFHRLFLTTLIFRFSSLFLLILFPSSDFDQKRCGKSVGMLWTCSDLPPTISHDINFRVFRLLFSHFLALLTQSRDFLWCDTRACGMFFLKWEQNVSTKCGSTDSTRVCEGDTIFQSWQNVPATTNFCTSEKCSEFDLKRPNCFVFRFQNSKKKVRTEPILSNGFHILRQNLQAM